MGVGERGTDGGVHKYDEVVLRGGNEVKCHGQLVLTETGKLVIPGE